MYLIYYVHLVAISSDWLQECKNLKASK